MAGYLRAPDDLFPDELHHRALTKTAALRYGENPHQLAAFYAENSLRPRPIGVVTASQLHGKQLSFNNTYDLDAAWNVVRDFTAPTVAIIKHGNPCGLSCNDSLTEAFRRALATRPPVGFGGAIALNRTVDRATAEAISDVFFEDIIAPDYAPESLEILQKKRDLRVLGGRSDRGRPTQRRGCDRPRLDYKKVLGGFLVQTPDNLPEQILTRDVVTRRQPTLPS